MMVLFDILKQASRLEHFAIIESLPRMLSSTIGSDGSGEEGFCRSGIPRDSTI
jgi:hypothetical protein